MYKKNRNFDIQNDSDVIKFKIENQRRKGNYFLMKRDIKAIVKQMTLEEKAGMCSGEDFWHLKSVERLGIPSVMVSDGPHGLRKQDQEADHLGANDSIKAVCFPTACATACSFDRDLLYKLGETLGDECQAQNLSVILGPAVNIKRSPLCGRNFEYFSEDPYLASEMAGAHIKGVQSKNIGTSIKHFAANNQEYRRMSCSSEIDERTFREIYLGAFETAIKEGKPDTVMCSYNKINGEFANFAVLVSIAVLSFLVYGFAVIMGSGIAVFNAFGRLAPEIATRLGIAPIALVLPIEVASCLGRAASPIAPGIIVLAGFAKVSPIDIVKRTAPLLFFAMLVNIFVCFYLAQAKP